MRNADICEEYSRSEAFLVLLLAGDRAAKLIAFPSEVHFYTCFLPVPVTCLAGTEQVWSYGLSWRFLRLVQGDVSS